MPMSRPRRNPTSASCFIPLAISSTFMPVSNYRIVHQFMQNAIDHASLQTVSTYNLHARRIVHTCYTLLHIFPPPSPCPSYVLVTFVLFCINSPSFLCVPDHVSGRNPKRLWRSSNWLTPPSPHQISGAYIQRTDALGHIPCTATTPSSIHIPSLSSSLSTPLQVPSSSLPIPSTHSPHRLSLIHAVAGATSFVQGRQRAAGYWSG